jgi:hypothetical protein
MPSGASVRFGASPTFPSHVALPAPISVAPVDQSHPNDIGLLRIARGLQSHLGAVLGP